MFENEMVEFKEKLNEKLEREVVAFLNTTHGGSIYIGIADDGTVLGVEGIDSKQREIKDRIKNNISPSTIGLFEIATPVIEGRDCIQVIVSGGNQRPYFIRKNGSFVFVRKLFNRCFCSIFFFRCDTGSKRTPVFLTDLILDLRLVFLFRHGNILLFLCSACT